jgi:uncharacterized membrane-anchored protein
VISPVLATIVDTEALAKVIITSLIAGIGVTVAFSLTILGVTRFADMRRSDRPLEAGVFAVLATLALAVCVAMVVFGIAVMLSK